jgi:hypothetical protein
MRSIRRSFGVALEEEQRRRELEGGSTPEAVEVAETGAELSDDVLEVNDSDVEVETDQANTEEAGETVDALGELEEVAQEALQNGGFDKYGARIFQVAVQREVGRLGLSVKPMPALEDFGAASSRTRATQFALEAVGDQIKDIWKKIIEALKKAWKFIEDHWNKLFGAYETLDKRADALLAAAAKTTGDKKENFASPGIVKEIYIGSAAGQAGMAVLKKTAEEIFNGWKAMAGTAGEAAVTALEAIATSGAAPTESFSSHAPAGLTAASTDQGHGEARPNTKLLSTPELPGGKAVLFFQAENIDGLAGQGGTVTEFKKGSKAPELELKTLTSQEVIALAKEAKAIAGILKNYRSSKEAASNLKKKAISAAEKLDGAAGKEADEAKKANIQKAQKIASAFPNIVDQPYVKFALYTLSATKAFLAYGEQSLKQYGKK